MRPLRPLLCLPVLLLLSACAGESSPDAAAPATATAAAPAEAAPVPAAPTGPVRWDKSFAIKVLADMVRIRRMEERCAELYGKQKIRGFLHLYIGEEAVAAGSLNALRADDNLVATYREHGHTIAKAGGTLDICKGVLAELMGKATGVSAGMGAPSN